MEPPHTGLVKLDEGIRPPLTFVCPPSLTGPHSVRGDENTGRQGEMAKLYQCVREQGDHRRAASAVPGLLTPFRDRQVQFRQFNKDRRNGRVLSVQLHLRSASPRSSSGVLTELAVTRMQVRSMNVLPVTR